MQLQFVSYFSGVNEFEAIKKNYTKFVDAYGCLGVLRINEGKSFNFNFNFDTIAQIFWFSDTNFSLFPSLSFKVPLEQVSDLCDFLGLFCQNCLKLCRLIFFAKLRNNFSILFVHFRRPYFAFLGADYGVHLGRKTRNFGSLQSDECGNAIFTWIPTGRRKSSRNPEITLLWNILLCMV